MKSVSLPTAAALFVALTLATGGSSTTVDRDRVYRFNYENILGTSLELTFGAASEARAHRAETAALNEIDREAKILSFWDSNSEFSRWARTSGEPMHVSPELFEVLGLYDQWRKRTGGAVDASAEAVIRVWKNAVTQKRIPRQSELETAVARRSR